MVHVINSAPAETRFEFGRNWQRFLTVLNDERVAKAERSLQTMLDVETLAGKSFIDVGSGSGLFSLAAMRLGAERVHSFDYDAASVACTQELKRRYYPRASNWTVEQGSALDVDYLRSLSLWDVVYSWGVLHHTGDMWQALDNVAALVRAEGLLFISLYNDQGSLSTFWKRVKLFYNRGPLARMLTLTGFVPVYIVGSLAADVMHLQNPLGRYRRRERGMSIVYDWIDWLGGYPFEVAQPAGVVSFYERRGFALADLKTVDKKSGCNEYVFRRLYK